MVQGWFFFEFNLSCLYNASIHGSLFATNARTPMQILNIMTFQFYRPASVIDTNSGLVLRMSRIWHSHPLPAIEATLIIQPIHHDA